MWVHGIADKAEKNSARLDVGWGAGEGGKLTEKAKSVGNYELIVACMSDLLLEFQTVRRCISGEEKLLQQTGGFSGSKDSG